MYIPWHTQPRKSQNIYQHNTRDKPYLRKEYLICFFFSIKHVIGAVHF